MIPRQMVDEYVNDQSAIGWRGIFYNPQMIGFIRR